MFDDVITLPTAKFRLHSDDPSFQVQWRGAGQFELRGEVSQEPSSTLDLETPSLQRAVSLPTKSKPEHAVKRLRRALPRDIRLDAAELEGALMVRLTELTLPAASPPRLRIFTTDTQQRTVQLESNRVEFVGATGDGCMLTILCDNKRTTIALPAHCSAAATAARVGSSVPSGFRALVDGATVTVWKDADFFRMVA